MKTALDAAIKRLPSLRTLYVFEAAARHLNLVRAAQEIGLTQGALSRQIKSLEDHIGVPLFVRTSRGLQFTEVGDILWHHCQRAFAELNEGLTVVSGQRSRQTLLLAVARSYATRVLARRVGNFTEKYPWIDLVLDGHRHLADLIRNEADAAIRVGDGKWPDIISERIQNDYIVPVASPLLINRIGTSELDILLKAAPLLHYSERQYWDEWLDAAGLELPQRTRNIRFTESTMVLAAVEAGQGIAIARHSLVQRELSNGELVQLSDITLDDGIAYFFCTSSQSARRDGVRHFRDWLLSEMSADARMKDTPSST